MSLRVLVGCRPAPARGAVVLVGCRQTSCLCTLLAMGPADRVSCADFRCRLLRSGGALAGFGLAMTHVRSDPCCFSDRTSCADFRCRLLRNGGALAGFGLATTHVRSDPYCFSDRTSCADFSCRLLRNGGALAGFGLATTHVRGIGEGGQPARVVAGTLGPRESW